MKILLVGDYSNFHPTLAVGLAHAGHEVTVASDGSRWMATDRAIDLRRRLPGVAGGALLYTSMRLDRRLRGYDAVVLISPSFVTLRPHRLRRVFDMLRRHNGKVYLNACGTDKAYMDFVTATDCPLPYTEYRLPDGSPNQRTAEVLAADRLWQQGPIADLCDYVYEHVDGVATALYEYHRAMQRIIPADRLVYTGIPIDLDKITPVSHIVGDGSRPVHMFLGRDRSRMAFKGTDIIGEVAAEVAAAYPGLCTLEIVENVPYAEYASRQSRGDLILDQLYSLTPATNALMAMARGQAVLSGADKSFYDFIGERELYPVFDANPDPDKLYKQLVQLVNDRQTLAEAAADGREFVKRHNSADVVAARFIKLFES